jgi:hypothetical protein
MRAYVDWVRFSQKQSNEVKNDRLHQVTSIAWNTLGFRIFLGFSNGDLKDIERLRRSWTDHL